MALLDNLLGNAAVYFLAGNCIVVKLWQDTEKVKLTIENTGVAVIDLTRKNEYNYGEVPGERTKRRDYEKKANLPMGNTVNGHLLLSGTVGFQVLEAGFKTHESLRDYHGADCGICME